MATYLAQPSPVPVNNGATSTWTPNPQPAPAPTVGINPDQLWNQAWNAGYNNSTGSNPYSGYTAQGFSAGQQQYLADKAKTTTQKSPTNTPTNSFGAVPTSTPPSTTSTPNMGQVDQQLQDQINNLYGSNNALFDQQQSNLGTQRTNAIADVTRQGDLAQTQYQSALDQALGMVKSSTTDLLHSQQNADNQNTRQYNALSQTTMSRFGQGSSTGGALGELIATEYQRQAGNVRQAYNNSIDKIYQYEGQARQTFQQGIQKLHDDLTTQISTIDQNFNSGMLQIEAQRTQNEQAKTQAKIDLLTQAKNSAQAIYDYTQQKAIDYQYWLAQQKQATADALAYNDQLAKTAHDQAFQDSQDISNIPNHSINAQTPANNVQAFNISALNKKDTSGLDFLNPFATA